MRITDTVIGPAAFAAVLIAGAASAQAASDPTGVWINDTGRGAVEIKNCGAALCGHVVWVKDGADTKGCGKQIIGDATPAGTGRWDSGWIYSPEKRKNYDVELKPLADGTLRVLGYAGTKLFSRTMIWTRAPADLKRCGETQTAAVPSAPASGAPASVEAKSVATNQPAPSASAPSSAPAPADVKAGAKADAANAPASATAAKPGVTPASPAATSETDNSKSAEASTDNDNDGGEKPGKRASKGGLKLGDLDLDKVLTKTASGKCKLDLPWVKVQFDCDQD